MEAGPGKQREQKKDQDDLSSQVRLYFKQTNEPTNKPFLRREDRNREERQGATEMDEVTGLRDLPEDLISRILGFIEDIRDLHRCGATCKRWHSVVNSVLESDLPSGEQWHPLCLSVHTFSRSVTPLLRRAAAWPRLRQVDLSGCTWLGDDEVRPLVGSSLTHLRLSGLQRISAAMLQQIASGCNQMNGIAVSSSSSGCRSNVPLEQAPVPRGGDLVMPRPPSLRMGSAVQGAVPVPPWREQETATHTLAQGHPPSLPPLALGGLVGVAGDSDLDRVRVTQEMRGLVDRVRETQAEVRALVDGVRVLLGERGVEGGADRGGGEAVPARSRRPPSSPVRTPVGGMTTGQLNSVVDESGGWEGLRSDGRGRQRGGGDGGNDDNRGMGLRVLDLSRTTVRDRTVCSMAALGGWTNLRELRLDGCILVSDAGVTHMVGVCRKLQVLSLGSVGGLTNQGLASIGVSLRELEVLNLAGCRMVSDLRQVVRNCPRLVDLDLGDTGVRTSDVADIAWVATSLTRLSLRDCFIFDVGVSSIFRSVASFRRLTDLDLSGIKHLTEGLCSRLCHQQQRVCSLCNPIKFSQAWTLEKAGGWHVAWHALLQNKMEREEGVHKPQGMLKNEAQHFPPSTHGSVPGGFGGNTPAELDITKSLTGGAQHSRCAAERDEIQVLTNAVNSSVSSSTPASPSTNVSSEGVLAHRHPGSSMVVEGSERPSLPVSDPVDSLGDGPHTDIQLDTSIAGGGFSGSLTCLDLSGSKVISCKAIQFLAGHFPGMRHLSLAGCQGMSAEVLRECGTMWRALKSLCLGGVIELSVDREAVQEAVMSMACCSGASLESLSLDGCVVHDEMVSVISRTCTGLRSFSLVGCKGLGDEGLVAVASHCKGLKSLALGVPSAWRNRSLRCFSGLEDLMITNRSTLLNDELAAVLANCPGLTFLSLKGCTSITEDGIASIAECCPLLETLLLDSCDKITGRNICRLSMLRKLSLLECSSVTAATLQVFATGCFRLSSLVLPAHLGMSSLPVQPPGMGHICGIQVQSGFSVRNHTTRTWFSEARNCHPG